MSAKVFAQPWQVSICALAVLLASPLCAAESRVDAVISKYPRYIERLDVRAESVTADVIEFFSYVCSLCMQHRGLIAKVKAHIGERVTYCEYAVGYRSASERWRLASQVHRVLFLADRLSPELHESLFLDLGGLAEELKSEVDVQRVLNDHQANDLVSDVGRDREQRHGKQVAQLYKDIGAVGTPTLLVAGQFKIALRSAITVEEVLEILDAISAEGYIPVPRQSRTHCKDSLAELRDVKNK